MVSPYMPDVVVEIAFDSGFATPAASRTWTDVSAYVELADGIDISLGRGDERATADANTLSLRLDNRDGRFTAGLASSPYYPNVKLYRPIRVTATPPGGAASVRFIGYIDEWLTEWDGSDAYASAAITASSRLARLGLDAALRSIIEEQILADSPVTYYPMGEPEGATTAADASGNGADPLAQVSTGADVTFGTATGPTTDDLTAATFAGGKYLGAPVRAAVGAGLWVEAFVSTAAIGGIAHVTGATAPDYLRIECNGPQARAEVLVGFGSVTILDGTTNIMDGQVHHVAAQVTWGGQFELYVDGVLEDSAAAPASGFAPARLLVGPSFTGDIAHVALASATITAARISAHAAAGLSGFTGDTAAARLARYATLGHIAAAEVDATGTTLLGHINTTGTQVVEAMRQVETTEGGVLFDDRDGTLVMQARNHRYEAAVAFTLDMGAQQVEADFAPRLDPTSLLNDVTASNTTGTITARVVDTASRDEYGSATASVETAATGDGEPLQAAAWLVNSYAEPSPRVPSLSVDLLPLLATTQASVLAATVGTLFTVTGQPSQAAASSGSYFVEGYTETFGLESWSISFNVSPVLLTQTVLVLDSATRGLLDTNVLAY